MNIGTSGAESALVHATILRPDGTTLKDWTTWSWPYIPADSFAKLLADDW